MESYKRESLYNFYKMQAYLSLAISPQRAEEKSLTLSTLAKLKRVKTLQNSVSSTQEVILIK